VHGLAEVDSEGAPGVRHTALLLRWSLLHRRRDVYHGAVTVALPRRSSRQAAPSMTR
jgi:hypothetical protein